LVGDLPGLVYGLVKRLNLPLEDRNQLSVFIPIEGSKVNQLPV
jgi:hypothetical protein